MSTLINKLNSQQALVEKIRLLQKEERNIRAEILEELFGTDNLGTLKSQVGNSIVTGTYGQTYKFDQKDIEDALQNDFLSADAENAVRIKYELDKKYYDKLDDDVAEELDDYLIIKPSLPTLSVKQLAEEE